jgi:hypothetical protein
LPNIPDCPNSVKGNGCTKSDPVLEKEGDDFWSFRCRSCKVIYVVSKDGVRERSQFELAAKRKREAEEAYEARIKRRKYFVA